MATARASRKALFYFSGPSSVLSSSSSSSIGSTTTTTTTTTSSSTIRSFSKLVDLRSDTVTKPSRGMLEAAMNAPVGDDVMGEDPTVLKLEAHVAEWTGKEAALFVPTGTMANLCALLAHCHGRASEMIVGANSHICMWEGGNAAGMGGIHSRQLAEDQSTAEFQEQHIRDACRSDNDDHFAKTELLCLENTHNMLGGVALSQSYMDRMGMLSRELGIRLHVDGARIANAAIHHNVSMKDICKPADSVSICLSKGLGAPLGSVLVGETDFIRLAKRARKRCGGGMRQAGVVAAMGLYALQQNYERLELDHKRAQRLATELRRHGYQLPRGDATIDTNILYFGLPTDTQLSTTDYCETLQHNYGVQVTGGYSQGGKLFRAVTHLDVDDESIDLAIEAMVDILNRTG